MGYRQYMYCYKIVQKNAYTKDLRRTVIQLQCEAGVTASNVSKVIKTVSENIFHHTFEKLPCERSALRMCDEGYAISQVQAAGAVLEASNITIHSDGSSRDTKKIVSEQISTDKGKTIYLGYTTVLKNFHSCLLAVMPHRLKMSLTAVVSFFKSDSESSTSCLI